MLLNIFVEPQVPNLSTILQKWSHVHLVNSPIPARLFKGSALTKTPPACCVHSIPIFIRKQRNVTAACAQSKPGASTLLVIFVSIISLSTHYDVKML